MTAFTSKIFDQPLVTEPTAHTQDLYAALDPVVQAVLTDKNANVDALLAAANTESRRSSTRPIPPPGWRNSVRGPASAATTWDACPAPMWPGRLHRRRQAT